MNMLTIIWGLMYLVVLAASKPPAIINEPPCVVYYKIGEAVNLTCVAMGDPQPKYKWKRNEINFNPIANDSRVILLPGVGTLVFNSPQETDEGVYQCFATNAFGTSVSKNVKFLQAYLMPFPISSPVYYTPKLGAPLTLFCQPPESVPPATVLWVTKSNTTGGYEVYNYSDRVSMDSEDRLRFTNVKAEDFNGGMPYICMVVNNVVRKVVQGQLYYVKPVGTTEEYHSVAYLWADQDDRFGLRGKTFSMKCIFSGNPTPDVHWKRNGNKTIPSRAVIAGYGQELQIPDLQYEDEGSYECWGANIISSARVSRNFTLKVMSAPYFLEEPKDVEVGVGTDVEFTCLADGRPEPDIDWFINGVPLRDVTDARIKSSRFYRPLSNKILLQSVQLTDNMVVQCNASNFFGYVFADVTLSVF